ncbi:hypothetical protein JAAARDRAFT_125437 [Jaapia argillacea MUCL 33604]|uniref:AAA+ ATPase domain-containing protein n=1 Tax=Jaapia argillacea MUCL 33604 TaxID=933084 RepID=A0A067QDM6_9AGAM|nr:hypothetical protein JAAARDRAFT_125437 [Jaapia argillacea MUCL 33604]
MRSQFLLRRSRSLSKTCLRSQRPSLVIVRPRAARDPTSPRPTRVYKRSSSSSSNIFPLSPETEGTPVSPEDPAPPENPPEEPERPKRRTRSSASSKEDATSKDSDSPPQLPNGIDILWIPDEGSVSSQPGALPPPDILDEALHNLQITLHPQTQHRATYPSPQGPPVEPTLALYCPIEGGDYVIDETVRELARRTDSEVVIMDAVQLAAGECGQFGKAASVIQLPRNPLHFQSSPSSPSRPNARVMMENEDEDDDGPQMGMPSQMTLHVLAHSPVRSTRAFFTPSARNNPSKAKAFFDELVNVTPATESSGTGPSIRKPRLIYIRDFGTLSASSSTWFPPLLSAVRQRRQGPLSRPTSPVTNPMTIILGVTPPIAANATGGSGGIGCSSLMNMIMSGRSSSASGVRHSKSDWSEDESADKARERRLRMRLKKWEKGDASLHDELPRLSLVGEDNDASTGSRGQPDVVVLGAPGGVPGFPAGLGSMIAGQGGGRGLPSERDMNTRYFRTSIVVPAVRSLTDERACRIARRREINELTMRMAVGVVGGVLEKMEDIPEPQLSVKESSDDGKDVLVAEVTEGVKMWEAWGQRIEDWSTVMQVADRAVGIVVTETAPNSKSKPSLDSTAVPWSVIHRSWASRKASRDVRKAWMKEASENVVREQDEEDGDEEEDEGLDEVIERVKRDPDLDSHEQRLLGCIVNAASMPTSFDQVHLPVGTIDAVRTIVSLPILHPAAFQHGILKQHSMTGCLLFGPPGTGKTLTVRALAKEAGCRMLAVSPSDVMDMYVGEGEKLVKSVFSLARRLAPCVVFLDEIDALFGARSSARETGGAIAHRGVITEFMQEMDGLRSSKDDNIIVIGATNRPFDLDDAVLRRLPRRLLIDLPGEKEREEILKILLRDETLSPEVSLGELAKKTESFSGSDLKHLCVSAALDAVKERVSVPWATLESKTATPPPSEPSQTVSPENPTDPLSSPDSAQSPADADGTNSSEETPPNAGDYARVLCTHNFAQALKEIVPSSSESLGSLADLRKWNEEFGEGRKDRKQQVWGKGRFGFTNRTPIQEQGRVAVVVSSTSESPLDP